jgi:hypothetical protein
VFCRDEENKAFGSAKIGELNKRPLRGIGRLAFQTGETNVRCGGFKLRWLYPTQVSFDSETRLADHGIELAPTRWTSIDAVQPDDPQLQWFRLDETRKLTFISAEDL